MLQWFKCLFGLHDVDPRMVIEEMGAVFHGDVCHACLRPIVGKFICNAWDEAQTLQNSDGSSVLRGMNPALESGLQSGAYLLLGDEESLHKIADLAREKRRQSRA